MLFQLRVQQPKILGPCCCVAVVAVEIIAQGKKDLFSQLQVKFTNCVGLFDYSCGFGLLDVKQLLVCCQWFLHCRGACRQLLPRTLRLRVHSPQLHFRCSFAVVTLRESPGEGCRALFLMRQVSAVYEVTGNTNRKLVVQQRSRVT